jgi:hypothetical protein
MDWLSLSASTIIISVGLIKFSEYVRKMCMSNTTLIIRQGDQIHFLLNRLIDLNKKIVKLENEFITLTESSISSSICLSTIEEEENENENVEADEDVEADEADEDVVEETFELIDKRLSPTSNKKSGWLSFLF